MTEAKPTPRDEAREADSSFAEDPSYGEIVWGQLLKRKLAVGSMWGLLGLLMLAIYAPVVASNKPFIWRVDDGPWQSPWLTTLFDRNFFESGVDLFFNSLMVGVTLLAIPTIILWRKQAGLRRAQRTGNRRRILQVVFGIWAVGFLGVVFFPSAAPKEVYPRLEARLVAEGSEVTAVYPPMAYSFRDGNIQDVRRPISKSHWLGTDNAGRDVMTRMIYGTRISLTVGVFAVALYISFGTMIGAVAGFYGGRVDIAIQRFIEVVICVPSIFLILTIAAFIEGRSIFHILALIALVRWTGIARLVRGEFLRLRNLDFVASATAAGYRESTIIFREVLPNALGPVLVAATFGVAGAILLESTISFLGLGDITVPSWGQILSTGRSTGMWVLILAPGFAIFLTVSLLNLVGEGLRDALDPKLRK